MDKLEEQAFTPCHSQQVLSFGFVSPLGKHSESLVHSAGNFMMVAVKRQERILPAAVVNEEVEERAEAISAKESRKLSRKERLELKDQVTMELLPRAFTRAGVQYAYIDLAEGLLVIDSSSAKRADELIDSLREAVGSLPVIPLTPKNIPLKTMTSWLTSGDLPEGFNLGDECELKALSDEGAIVRCKHQDLQSDEIQSLLGSGLHATRLHLFWKDRLECIVDEKLAVKRLKFTDIVMEQIDSQNIESAPELFDADFALMTMELRGFIQSLIPAFGGENLNAAEERLNTALVAETE
ncbi:Recombination-associated protein RdgC [BD1-7 clade bacterium]|uniref:Recombination-associated protein RdgC n=1 Tax=BD1-7 clade bacterium TaxID=2029982 RepID=A0A5S9QUH3_9GAMM|nr:Recombination-associated protein RdgC [BD1-7 clade bacterium]